jgi:hypothetical protein
VLFRVVSWIVSYSIEILLGKQELNACFADYVDLG